MEEVYVVRHRHLVEGVPIRRLAREMGVSRNTIKRYLRGAAAGVGKPRGAASRTNWLRRLWRRSRPRVWNAT